MPSSAAGSALLGWTRCSLPAVALIVLYSDAVLRVLDGFYGGGFGPLLAAPHERTPLVSSSAPIPPSFSPSPSPPTPQREAAARAVTEPHVSPLFARTANLTAEEARLDVCAKHDLLLGNLYADFAPWVDRRLRIEEWEMARTIDTVAAHRGRWDSWVTDTLTPLLIKDGRIYLTLGPPQKDPTNYFWTVLAELQKLARTVRLPDVELLLNFADTPIVFAAADGRPSAPHLPVFSYCKRARFLDVLVPGYYTPDRVCQAYRAAGGANEAHPWRTKRRVAFARYTHFCKFQTQQDLFGRPLPPCARSWFAALAATPEAAGRLDVKPLNVVNDTNDPSLAHGARLLAAGASLPLADHGRYAYLLDTDGFTSAYKLQQLLSTNSLVLHHRSPWRAYYHAVLAPYVHYAPIWRSSRDDILRVLEWLDAHSGLAQRIARSGQHLACEHLTQPGRLCYWQRAIELYASFFAYTPSLAHRPRAFPLDALNIMCRVRDAPVVCYYNVKFGRLRGSTQAEAPPKGYVCEKPVAGDPGLYEECWYRGSQPPTVA